jgi:hypothetical protein
VLGRFRPRLTYANVVSTLCLFIVLGGSSYAAVTLKRNSVRSAHIKNGQVKRPDVARNAIDSSKVGDGSLLSQDFAPGQLPDGPKGEPGATGAQGPPGVSGLERPIGTSAFNSDSPKGATATCSPGKSVVGTGANLNSGTHTGDPPNRTADVVITAINPTPPGLVPATVSVVAMELAPGTPNNWSVSAQALCANVSP